MVRSASILSVVMPGLVPGIHVLLAAKTWMAGTSPAMTHLFQFTAAAFATVIGSSRHRSGNIACRFFTFGASLMTM